MYLNVLDSTQIYKQLGLSYGTVRWALKDIAKRSKGGYKGYRKYNVDHNYFEVINSYNKAYIIGFIATDGNIYRNVNNSMDLLQIGLSIKDLDHLTKINSLLSSTYPIKISKETKLNKVREFRS